MTDAPNQKYDLVIIGTGMAGMAAAVFAANRGITTAIVGSLGESWFTGGLIDLMGVHPIGSGKTWRDPWAVSVGGEAAGSSVEARSQADRLITIPSPQGVESLNTAVAGSVILFEARRQRRSGGTT